MCGVNLNKYAAKYKLRYILGSCALPTTTISPSVTELYKFVLFANL